MLLNAFPVNDVVLDGGPSYTLNNFITIEKSIAYRATFEGSLLTVAKNIKAQVSAQPLITIAKIISNATINTFYTRNGFEPIVTLGGITLRAQDLCGGVKVVKTEGDNSTASFSIILYPNTYNLYTYQGQDVTISVRKNGIVYRLFTGKVDVPMVDVFDEKLTLNCVADRRVLLANLSGSEPYIGYYSASVLGLNDNIADRINQRMSTIPASLDFDSYNNAYITSWTAKASPDYSFGSSAVYRRNPQLAIDSAGQVLNKVNLSMEYGYQRHYQASTIYTWVHPYGPTNPSTGVGNICPFLFDRPSMPTKQMILSAIESSGWAYVPAIGVFFGKQFLSGSYNCGGVWAQWSTLETGNINGQVRNADGTATLDASGNPIYRSVQTIVADNTDVYTMFAQWTSTLKFDQNIKESYTLSISSPESIARYGEIAQSESYGYTAIDPNSQWESTNVYTNAPAGVVVHGSGYNYYFNGDQDRPTFNNAYTCAIHKAQTSILKSHRQNRINFQRELSPDMELYHTVSLSGKWVRGKGKIQSITHYMNISDNDGGVGGEAYSDITLLQYRGHTTVTDTPLTVTAAPSDPTVAYSASVNLDTHLGEDPTQSGAQYWNGYIGNNSLYKQTGPTTFAYTRSQWQESFIVDTPAIPDQYRKDKELTKTASYDVNIPNDDTEYQSYG